MRAGKLDREITIERLDGETLDAHGVPQGDWLPVATLRAQLLQATTEEFLRAHGASTESVVIFRTRFLDGLTLADRVVYNSRVHRLVEIKELGRRRGMELRTVALGV